MKAEEINAIRSGLSKASLLDVEKEAFVKVQKYQEAADKRDEAREIIKQLPTYDELLDLLESQLQERDNAFQEKLKDIIKEIQERRPDIIKDKYFAGLDDGFEVSTMILDKHINLTPKQDPKQS
jgi:septum formation inhibitor-activating ATPase MinD